MFHTLFAEQIRLPKNEDCRQLTCSSGWTKQYPGLLTSELQKKNSLEKWRLLIIIYYLSLHNVPIFTIHFENILQLFMQK